MSPKTCNFFRTLPHMCEAPTKNNLGSLTRTGAQGCPWVSHVDLSKVLRQLVLGPAYIVQLKLDNEFDRTY